MIKSASIIRRIDDLGRVVIPKEIRRTMRIREGDPLEVYIEDNKIMIKKYGPSPEQAASWLNNQANFIEERCIRFFINGPETVCIGIENNHMVEGKTKCNPCDNYNPCVGMVYAMYRAFPYLILPDGWEE